MGYIDTGLAIVSTGLEQDISSDIDTGLAIVTIGLESDATYTPPPPVTGKGNHLVTRGLGGRFLVTRGLGATGARWPVRPPIPPSPDVKTDYLAATKTLFISQFTRTRTVANTPVFIVVPTPVNPVTVTDAPATNLVEAGLSLFISQFSHRRTIG